MKQAGAGTTKVVELVVGDGNFQYGFPVVLLMGSRGRAGRLKLHHRLPRNPQFPEIYAAWQSAYLHWGAQQRGRQHLRIQFPNQTTNISHWDEFEQATQALQTCLANWFDQSDLRDIRESILLAVSPQERARLFIQTQDPWLRRLPWHLWPLLEKRSQLEIGMSAENALTRPLPNPVKILAIFGSSEGLNLQVDQSLLQGLPNAIITQLIAPSRRELSERLFEARWDILFFAGHSHSAADGETGYLNLNATERLSPTDLKFALRQAVQEGLQLAIFNSCDGLGLARALADLHIPYLIVMREPVPDQIAHAFLGYFLKTFAKGTPFHLAVRRAREQLQGWESTYPYASWLPVICQNPHAPALKYPQGLRRRDLLYLAGGMGLTSLGIQQWLHHQDLDRRTSMGEQLLFSTTTSDKQDGAKAVSRRDWSAAAEAFKNSLGKHPNDPEALIYYENAKIEAANAKAWLIAVSVPSATIPDVAQEILRGCAQYQAEWNHRAETQTQVHRLKLVLASDDNDPQLAAALAQRFVKNPQVLAVIGHNASDASLAAAEIYQRGRLVMITPTSFSDRLSGSSDYVFRMVLSIRFLTRLLAEYYVECNKEFTIANCFTLGSPDNESFYTQFSNELKYLALRHPKIILSQQKCEIQTPNFQANPTLQRLRNNGVNTLLLAPHVNRLPSAIELIKTNQGKLKLLGSTTLFTAQTLEIGAAANGLVIVSPWQHQMFPNHPFFKHAQQLWQLKSQTSSRSVTWRTAMAYDATLILLEALKNQNSSNRADVKNYLRSGTLKVEGATGTIRFTLNGEREIIDNFGILLEVKQVGYTYDFVPIAKSVTSPCKSASNAAGFQ